MTTTPISLGTQTLRTGVTLKSLASNTVDIYIGNSAAVSLSTGYVLSPGETLFLELSTISGIFARTSSGTATITAIGT